ncbi:MAG: hypothetical protein RLZZ499_3237, partial [Cyanobacteriota bacterium]
TFFKHHNVSTIMVKGDRQITTWNQEFIYLACQDFSKDVSNPQRIMSVNRNMVNHENNSPNINDLQTLLSNLKMNREYIEIFGVGESRYDLVIKRSLKRKILFYVRNWDIPKSKIMNQQRLKLECLRGDKVIKSQSKQWTMN